MRFFHSALRLLLCVRKTLGYIATHPFATFSHPARCVRLHLRTSRIWFSLFETPICVAFILLSHIAHLVFPLGTIRGVFSPCILFFRPAARLYDLLSHPSFSHCFHVATRPSHPRPVCFSTFLSAFVSRFAPSSHTPLCYPVPFGLHIPRTPLSPLWPLVTPSRSPRFSSLPVICHLSAGRFSPHS